MNSEAEATVSDSFSTGKYILFFFFFERSKKLLESFFMNQFGKKLLEEDYESFNHLFYNFSKKEQINIYGNIIDLIKTHHLKKTRKFKKIFLIGAELYSDFDEILKEFPKSKIIITL